MTATITSYQQAIDWIFGLINFEKKPGQARDFRLDRTRQLLAAVGNPQNEIPAVHIAGTKGKGSTATMTAAILAEAGIVTGLFTSPHITRFEERFKVNGEEPTPEELIKLVQELQVGIAASPGLMPTYFEAAMVLAWCFYRMRKVQIAVLEVGLGGRLDSTNVCRPEVCVITNISLDHTLLLGDTVDKIAAEKAGIMKPGVPVVSGVTNEPARTVIRDKASASDASLFELDGAVTFDYEPPSATRQASEINVRTHLNEWSQLELPLPGKHQAANCALAITAIDILKEKGWRISDDSVRHALQHISIPGRIETLARKPLTIVDAAHNEASAVALVSAMNDLPDARPRVAIFGTTKQKDVVGMLEHLLPAFDYVVITEYRENPRAVPWEGLLEQAQQLAGANVQLHSAPDPQSAWDLATSIDRVAEGMICTTGSFFIAAEVREIILREQQR